MPSNDEAPREVNFSLRGRPENESGEYCDGLLVGHSPNGFRLDFYQTDPIEQPEAGPIEVSGLIVSRLHIPHAAMANMVEALNDNWGKYVDKAMPRDIPND